MSCGCGCNGGGCGMGELARFVERVPPELRFLIGAPAPRLRTIAGDDSDGGDASFGLDFGGDSSSSSSTDTGSLVQNGEDSLGNLNLGSGVTANDVKDSISQGVTAGQGDVNDLAKQFSDGNYSAAVQNGVADATKLSGAVVTTYDKAQTVVASFNDQASDAPDFDGSRGRKANAAVAGIFTVIATAIGGAWGAALGAAMTAIITGKIAHAGYGACATDPPSGSSFDQLKAWKHYTSFDTWAFGPNGGTYPKNYPADSFEAWANPILEYNWALSNNCFGGIKLDNGTTEQGLFKPPAVLLGTLVAAWNLMHAGPLRTITRSPQPCDFTTKVPAGWIWDPIAASMPYAWDDANGCAVQKPVSIQVKTGPQVKEIKLHLSPAGTAAVSPGQLAAALAQGQVKTSAVTPSKAVLVAGGSAAAAGGYLVYTAGGVKPALLILRRLLGV